MRVPVGMGRALGWGILQAACSKDVGVCLARAVGLGVVVAGSSCLKAAGQLLKVTVTGWSAGGSWGGVCLRDCHVRIAAAGSLAAGLAAASSFYEKCQHSLPS